MIIFIDESGIHKKIDHSTISLVYVEVLAEKDLESRIKEIESDLKIRHFHWSDYGSRHGWKIRRQFIEQVSRLNFSLKVGILKNPVDMAQALDDIFDSLITEKKIFKIVIDGKHPLWYQRRIKSGLRRKGITVKKLRMASDESVAGLRLADALAGLIRSHYDRPTELAILLFKLLQNKITAQLGGQEIR